MCMYLMQWYILTVMVINLSYTWMPYVANNYILRKICNMQHSFYFSLRLLRIPMHEQFKNMHNIGLNHAKICVDKTHDHAPTYEAPRMLY